MTIDNFSLVKYFKKNEIITQDNTVLGNISSFETFGTFDGPGIRFVLFLQGCPFRCQFCHNRETWEQNKEQIMSVGDVYDLFSKYRHFYKKGGLTISGGEATFQPYFTMNLFKKMRENNIHTCLDTSAGCFESDDSSSVEIHKNILEYTDLILLDIKQINDEKHIKLVGKSNKNVLLFAKYLESLNKDVIIRHVLIPGYTDNDQDLIELRSFLNELTNVIKIEVLPYHSAGSIKWKQMGFTYPLEGVEPPSKKRIENAYHILTNNYKFSKSHSN